MSRGRPRTVREDYTRIKLQKDTHRLWVERKAALQLNSDDELARLLLGLAEMPVPLFQSVPQTDIDANLQHAGTFISSNSCRHTVLLQFYMGRVVAGTCFCNRTSWHCEPTALHLNATRGLISTLTCGSSFSDWEFSEELSVSGIAICSSASITTSVI